MTEQRAGIADRVNDLRIRVPDQLAAEERQARRVTAVALHRIEDVIVAQTVAPARLEVLDAIGRRAVDDAGAGVEGNVLAEIDGCEAFVERVTKGDVLERLSLGRRDSRSRESET